MLAARSEQQLTRAILQVQLHGAKADTKYLGLIKAPFIGGGSDRHVGEVTTDVAAGSKRGGRPIIGQLTARPGDYRLTMTLDAVQGGDAVSRAAPSSDCFLSPSMRRREVELRSGDLFVAFTDGVPEARNVAEEEFGEER